jgi:hypothetical protein
MNRLRWSAARSALLAIPALAALALCHLALTDIWHGGEDLAQEWWALRLGFVVMFAAQLSALATAVRVLGMGGRGRWEP